MRLEVSRTYTCKKTGAKKCARISKLVSHIYALKFVFSGGVEGPERDAGVSGPAWVDGSHLISDSDALRMLGRTADA